MEGESAVKHRPVVRLAEPRRAPRAGVASLFTEHARVRMQQRGIVYLKKTYAILGAGGAIVTVGHRTRRIPRS
jgi:hypothetical protein